MSLTAAQQLLARGHAVIPVPAGEKGPQIPGWQKLRLSGAQLAQHFKDKTNIGVLNGEPSGWRVDVDLDHPLAVAMADEYLPGTASIFGRKGKPRSHRQYIAVDAKTRQFKLSSDRSMIVELRSTGSQTIFPGSFHPSGEPIEWDVAGEPATVDAAELLAAVERLAEAVAQKLETSIRKPPVASRKRAVGEIVDMARDCIAEEPPAVAGKGGHNQTFHVACELFRFGLSDADAAALLNEYNERCVPPWSPNDLQHKLDDARVQVLADGEFGVHIQTEKEVADLDTAAAKLNARRDTKAGYLFKDLASAIEAVKLMGGKLAKPEIADRQVRLWLKDNWLNAEMDKLKGDPTQLAEWTRRTNKWDCGVVRLPEQVESEPLGAKIDTDIIRHVVATGGGNIGWTIKIDGEWVDQTKDNCKSVILKLYRDLSTRDATALLGGSILESFWLVDRPFEPEYPEPGKSVWNRFGAQLRYEPSPGDHPTFDKVLENVGWTLDEAVSQNKWCQKHEIRTGAQYLLVWAASVFQRPSQKLPYLFFYGKQNSGKTTFHEMLGMLMTKGYKKVDKAFTRTTGFNAEMEGVILAVIEESNLAKNLDQAYSLIKDVTTSPTIAIERKGWDVFEQANRLHCVQCGQYEWMCPIADEDDSRVVVIKVPELAEQDRISSPILREMLAEEAPAFLYRLKTYKLPTNSAEDDRLFLPVLYTPAKWAVIESIRKLQNLQPSERPAGVLAQQIADQVRELAHQGWIVKKTAGQILTKLKSLDENLTEHPSQLGQALDLINLSGFNVKHERTSQERLITITPDVDFKEEPPSEYLDEVRVANLF